MRVTTGHRLREIMKERKLKQVDILNLTNKHSRDGVKISKTDLSQYVNGKTEPRQDKLYILAEALDVNEAWLMGYDVDKARIPENERLNESQKQTPEFFAIQRNSKKLSQKEQQRLLKIMKATFDKLDDGVYEDDDSDDYL